MQSVALVIGNGFDLDLGLKTKYSDFADKRNPEWEEWLRKYSSDNRDYYSDVTEDQSLLHQMYVNRNKENWFDIEEEIHKYVNSHKYPSTILIGLVRKQFEELKESFTAYLKRVALPTNVNNDSLARDLFVKVYAATHCVFTFNYTDCYQLCQCQRHSSREIMFVHGSIVANDIILGCREFAEKKKVYKLGFLYKPFIESGIVTTISQNLIEAKDVLIFGHSLNQMDMCFFTDYFKHIEQNLSSGKHLTIVCKDNASEAMIMQHLKARFDLERLCNNVDFSFIHTDSWYKLNNTDRANYRELCKRLECYNP